MAVQAMGTVFQFTPQGGQATTVGKLTSVGKISPDSKEIDVTTLDSQGYREYMQGFRDSGEVEISGFHTKSDSGQQALRAAYESGKAGEAIVTFSDGTTASFTAFVKSYTLGAAEVDGAVGFGATLRISGGVTIA